MKTIILYIIYIHGFQGDHTSFQSFPTDIHNTITVNDGTRSSVLPPHVTLKSIIYPTYQSRKSIHQATADFLRWMYTLPPGPIILVGHSMGGLLAADAAYLASSHKESETRIIGVLACDVPYLGMHPHVVLSGLSSLLPKRKNKRDDPQSKRIEASTSPISGNPRISPSPSPSPQPPPSPHTQQNGFPTEKEMNDERLVDVMDRFSFLTDDDDGRLDSEPLKLLSAAWTPSDPMSSGSTPQPQQQPASLLPPALPPRPSSCPPNAVTPDLPSQSSPSSPKQLYPSPPLLSPPPPTHPYIHLRAKSQSNLPSALKLPIPEDSANLISRTLHLLHPNRNTNSNNNNHFTGTSSHLDIRESADKAKQQAVKYYDSIVETMEFGISMFDPKELLERYRLLTAWKGHWFAFWTVVTRQDKTKGREIDSSTTTSHRTQSYHHFVVTPHDKNKWERVIIHGAKDEVEAHISLFKRDLNWEYDAFVSRAAYILSRWIIKVV